MSLQSLTYLISILLITIAVLLDEWIVGGKKLRPYWLIIIITSFFGLLYAMTEAAALKWLVWSYNPDKVLNIQLLGVQIETYLLNILIFPIISSSTLLLMHLKHKRSRKSWKNYFILILDEIIDWDYF